MYLYELWSKLIPVYSTRTLLSRPSDHLTCSIAHLPKPWQHEMLFVRSPVSRQITTYVAPKATSAVSCMKYDPRHRNAFSEPYLRAPLYSVRSGNKCRISSDCAPAC